MPSSVERFSFGCLTDKEDTVQQAEQGFKEVPGSPDSSVLVNASNKINAGMSFLRTVLCCSSVTLPENAKIIIVYPTV